MWCMLIESLHFRTQQAGTQSLSQTISRFIADLLFSVFMELLFLVQVSVMEGLGLNDVHARRSMSIHFSFRVWYTFTPSLWALQLSPKLLQY